MSADLDDLRERASAYLGLAALAGRSGQRELSAHARGLSEKYYAELEAAAPSEYLVPVDPADATNCEACQ